jgi:hypothetical protein
MINAPIRSRRIQAIVLMAVGVLLVWQIITGSFTISAFRRRKAQAFAREPTALVVTADKRLNQHQ